MDTVFHGKIGKILGLELISKGYLIDIKSFIRGNMLPDILPKYRFSMHEKKGNYKDVKILIKELMQKKLDNKELSKKLGIITHYLCDFFTFPHNENYKKSIISHEIYERFQRHYMKNRLNEIWEKHNEECKVKINTMEDILKYIDDMHSIYMVKESTKERDVIFASILIRVVNFSILSIINSSEEITTEKVIRKLNVV